jgi:hypothetical protein
MDYTEYLPDNTPSPKPAPSPLPEPKPKKEESDEEDVYFEFQQLSDKSLLKPEVILLSDTNDEEPKTQHEISDEIDRILSST